MVGRMSALRSQPLRSQLIGSDSTSSPGAEAGCVSALPPASVSSRASVAPSGSEVVPEGSIEADIGSKAGSEAASCASSGVVWGDIGGCLGVWGKEGGRGASDDCPATVA